MGIELSNTGLGFTNNSDPKWIQFNSGIAIRKDNEGWIINARVDNWSNVSETSFNYMLTTYKYEGNAWKKDGESKLWMDPKTMDGDPAILSTGNTEAPITVHIHNKKLMIKNPETTWFSGLSWISQSQDAKARIKKHAETKSWSGVWIDDEKQESNSWIFKDIELYIEDKRYSQVFCKGEESGCFQANTTSQTGSITKPQESDKWSEATKGAPHGGKIKDEIPSTVKGIINKLKNSKGTWMKLEDICDAKIDETTTEERKKQLRMYCSNGRQIN